MRPSGWGSATIPEVTTRRGFIWACGASTAAILCTGEAGELLAEIGRRATGFFDAVTLKTLAEQTRQVLATMTPREEHELRVRYGVG